MILVGPFQLRMICDSLSSYVKVPQGHFSVSLVEEELYSSHYIIVIVVSLLFDFAFNM